MSQNKPNRRLIECLDLAQREHESLRPGGIGTTSNDCIDPRLLAISNDAAYQDEVHASNSTASDCIDPRLLAISNDAAIQERAHASSSSVSEILGSANCQGIYLGSPSDDSAFPESG
jgi:hypothetical protein